MRQGEVYEADWVFDVEGDYRRARDAAAEADAAARAEAAPGDSEALLAEAVARNDLAATLGVGGVLAARGRMPEALVGDYIAALQAEGRTAEHVAALRELEHRQVGSPGYWFTLAEGWARLGRFADARACALRAEALSPSLEVANFARRAKWVSKLARGAAGLDWKDARTLVEGALSLKADGAAATLVEAYAARPPEGEPRASDAVRLAAKALRLDRPAAAAAFIARIPQGEAATERAVLLVEHAGRTGAAAAAAAAADRLLEAPLPEIDDLSLARLGLDPRQTAAAAYAAAGRAEDAVRLLDALVVARDEDLDLRKALMRAVGQYVLSQLDLPWAPPRPPRVINLLPFYNEHLLLELRLAEMGDWVDHFVVTEAAETFTGRAKPLNFAQQKDRFQRPEGQLLSVGIERFPAFMRSAWARELYQRDMAVSALGGLWRPDDVVLITDADEVVDRGAAAAGWPHLANLRMITSKFFFNYVADRRSKQGFRRSGAVCRAELLSQCGSSWVRSGLSAARKRWESLPSAGWHFTSIGDAAVVAGKFQDFSHQEADKAAMRDAAQVDGMLSAVRAGAREPGWAAEPVGDGFPSFLRDNAARLGPLVLPA